LPITYQKLNAECDDQARVPNTTFASPAISGASRSARSAARYSRSASRTAAYSPVADASAVRIGVLVPQLLLVRAQHARVQQQLDHLSHAHGKRCREHVLDRREDRGLLVEDRHENRECAHELGCA
jgi:hypothetical protein